MDLDRDEIDALQAPFSEPGDYTVTYGGDIGLAPTAVIQRFNDVFGPTRWGLIKLADEAIIQDKEVNTFYTLYINGSPVLSAPGGSSYDKEKNKKKTLSYALESARTNALQRVAKHLGIGRECWDKSWSKDFRDKYCVNDGGWKMKSAVPAPKTADPFKVAFQVKPIPPAVATPKPAPAPLPPFVSPAQDPIVRAAAVAGEAVALATSALAAGPGAPPEPTKDRRKDIVRLADYLAGIRGVSPQSILAEVTEFETKEKTKLSMTLTGSGKLSVAGASDKWIDMAYGKIKKKAQEAGFLAAAPEASF